MSKIREDLTNAWRRFKESPMDFFDEIQSPKIGGRRITWGLKDYRFRLIGIVGFLIGGICWAYFGFDSTLHYTIANVPFLAQMFGHTNNFGAGMHWSTIQLYAAVFVILSYWLYKEGISGTRNVLYSGCALLFTIGFFEIVWMSLYDIIHFQDLMLWAFGDGTVFWRNVAWLCCLPLAYLVLRVGTVFRPKFKINYIFGILLGLTAISWAFWIWYPLPHTIFTGYGNVGSPLFPQTVYTLNVPAQGGVSLDALYLPDDLIHLTNIIVKYVATFAMLYFFKVSIRTKSGLTVDEYLKRMVKGGNGASSATNQ